MNLKKIINTVLSIAVGFGIGFVLYKLLYAVFGSTWSTKEGGSWLVVYSPYFVLTSVGGLVGFFRNFKKALGSVILNFICFFVGGLVLMFVAGMFVGGGAIYVVFIIGVVSGGIIVLNQLVRGENND